MFETAHLNAFEEPTNMFKATPTERTNQRTNQAPPYRPLKKNLDVSVDVPFPVEKSEAHQASVADARQHPFVSAPTRVHDVLCAKTKHETMK